MQWQIANNWANILFFILNQQKKNSLIERIRKFNSGILFCVQEFVFWFFFFNLIFIFQFICIISAEEEEVVHENSMSKSWESSKCIIKLNLQA